MDECLWWHELSLSSPCLSLCSLGFSHCVTGLSVLLLSYRTCRPSQTLLLDVSASGAMKVIICSYSHWLSWQPQTRSHICGCVSDSVWCMVDAGQVWSRHDQERTFWDTTCPEVYWNKGTRGLILLTEHWQDDQSLSHFRMQHQRPHKSLSPTKTYFCVGIWISR